MYKLIKTDGVNPEAVSDVIYTSRLPQAVKSLYEYVSDEPDKAPVTPRKATAKPTVTENVFGAVETQLITPTEVDKVLTQEDLDQNPGLVSEGFKVGDVIVKK